LSYGAANNYNSLTGLHSLQTTTAMAQMKSLLAKIESSLKEK
jgi:hypothetical protein